MRLARLRTNLPLQPGQGASTVCQVALLAELAALRFMHDLDAVIVRACEVAARGTGSRLAGVLQYRADEDAFVLQAGVGWPQRLIGRVRVSACLGTTAGLAWHTRQPIQFGALSCTGRIRGPAAPDVASHSASVPIPGGSIYEFGILEVVRAGAGEFTQPDMLFLKAVAGEIAAAVKKVVEEQAEENVAGQGWERERDRTAGALGEISIPSSQPWQQDVQIGLGGD